MVDRRTSASLNRNETQRVKWYVPAKWVKAHSGVINPFSVTLDPEGESDSANKNKCEMLLPELPPPFQQSILQSALLGRRTSGTGWHIWADLEMQQHLHDHLLVLICRAWSFNSENQEHFFFYLLCVIMIIIRWGKIVIKAKPWISF